MLENRRQYAVEQAAEPAAREERAGASAKFRALKELTLALLSEVEALKEGRQLDAARTIDFAEEVRRFEIDMIRWALMRTGGHQRRAARLLNIKVTTLNAKIKRYGIRPSNLPTSNVVDLYPDAPRTRAE